MNRFPSQLELLTDENFLRRFEQISTAEGIYRGLCRSAEVRALNSAMREEVIDDAALDQFVRHLLRSFVPGEQFRYQIALAGIAVACESINKGFARQYIDYLANIQSSELRLAAMIARISRQSITKTVTKTFLVSMIGGMQIVQRMGRSSVGQRDETYDMELA
jgi:hypothetical protein